MLQYNPTVSGSLNITGSLQVSGDITGTVNGINITVLSQSVSSQLINVQSSTGSSDAKFETLSGVTSSALTRLTNIETKSASVDISISNINSITASNIARLSNLETKSSSVDISLSSINSFTSSNAIASLNSKTGSYATTGSNSFYGTQVFSGSVYIANDLVVQGSSSIQYISASSVSIGTNIIQLNTANPSVRFAGLSVIDSGSIGGSGSFLYDSREDEFIFVHRGNGTNVTSSHFVMGPETFDNLGNETYLTCNRLTKGTGKEHLVDSCITDLNGNIGINCSSPGFNLDINGVSGFNSNISSGANTAITATQNGTGYLFVGKCATSNRFRVGPTGFIIVDENSNNAGLTINQSGAGYSAIFCGGNVGIDITAPTLKLDVRGTLGIPATSGTSQYGYLRLTSNAGSSRTLDFGGYDSGRNYAMWIQATDWADLSVNSSLIINPNGGNVGIGTCTPGYKLDVNGEVAISPNTAGKNTFLLTTNASNDGRLLIKSDTTNKVDIQSNGASYFMGGNIGINCSTPNYKLHVNGCTAIDGNLRMGSGFSSGNSTDPGITVQGYSNAGVYFSNCGVGLGAGSSSNLLFLSCIGNVGIGICTPIGKLHVYKNGLSAVIGKMSDSNILIDIGDYGNSTYNAQIAFGYYSGTFTYAPVAIGFTPTTGAASGYGDLTFNTRALTTDTAPLERMRITSGGIVGIGTGNVLSWYNSGYTALQIGGMAGVFSNTSNTSTTGGLTIAYNIYVDSAGNYQYMNTTNARAGSTMVMEGGNIYFSNAVAGTGANPTVTERMRITCGGKVGIGSVAPNWLLEICCNTTATGGGGYPAIAINNPNDAGYSAYYFFKGAGNMGGMEVSNATCDFLLNTNCTLSFKTNNNTRIRICNTGESYFTCRPFFPGATLTCTYTCTFSSYTAGTWLGLFAGDNGYNGAYAFTVVGQFNLNSSGMYSINFSTVPYIHKSTSIEATNGNDAYGVAHTSAGHADNGALVCFRRARYSGNSPVGNRTEFCMNVSYTTSFTATTYVLAWV